MLAAEKISPPATSTPSDGRHRLDEIGRRERAGGAGRRGERRWRVGRRSSGAPFLTQPITEVVEGRREGDGFDNFPDLVRQGPERQFPFAVGGGDGAAEAFLVDDQ